MSIMAWKFGREKLDQLLPHITLRPANPERVSELPLTKVNSGGYNVSIDEKINFWPKFCTSAVLHRFNFNTFIVKCNASGGAIKTFS